MRKLKLNLTQSTFEQLHEAVDGRGKNCTIPKVALTKLLMDHSNMVDILKFNDIQLEMS